MHAPDKTPADPRRRYLRARKFIPSEAFGQFKDTEDWRKDIQLEKLYDTIDINEYEQTRVLVSRVHRQHSVHILTVIVPSMDWPTRPPRYSCIHLRSRRIEQQGYHGL
jgi:hypothetical protein